MINSYATLQAAIAERLHRTDLAERIPEFIQLAEAEINRRLTVYPKEVEAVLTAVPGSRFVALPDDFDSPVGLWATHVDPRYEITPVLANQLTIHGKVPALPRQWAIDGANIAFDYPADTAYPLALRYLQSVYLSDEQPTNAVFARAPDLYLYGALAEAADHCYDDARAAQWVPKFRALLLSVSADMGRTRANAPLQTELAALLGRSGASYLQNQS